MFQDSNGKKFTHQEVDGKVVQIIESKTGDATYQSPRIDVNTHTLLGMSYAHHKVHAGDSYSCHYSVTTGNVDDHRTAIGFITPNTTEWAHCVVTVTASDPAEFFWDEAPTIDLDAGTDLTIFNRNRNSTNTSSMLSVENPGVAGGATSYDEAEIAAANFVAGTIIEYVLMAGGSSPQAIGGMSRGTQEIILKKNTKYLFMLKNTAQNANTHVITVDWYEHTNKTA